MLLRKRRLLRRALCPRLFHKLAFYGTHRNGRIIDRGSSTDVTSHNHSQPLRVALLGLSQRLGVADARVAGFRRSWDTVSVHSNSKRETYGAQATSGMLTFASEWTQWQRFGAWHRCSLSCLIHCSSASASSLIAGVPRLLAFDRSRHHIRTRFLSLP